MRVLHNRQLLIIAVAESVSSAGSWISMMAVFAMLVFHGSGGVGQSSGIYLSGLLLTLIASPLAGLLCDRFDRRRLMIGSELLSGVLVSGLIFTSDRALIYALIALESASIAIMAPARQSVLPSLVSREELTRANAFLQQLAGIIKIAAPLIAGLLLAFMSPHTAIVVDVASFAASALLLSRLPALNPAGGARAGRALAGLSLVTRAASRQAASAPAPSPAPGTTSLGESPGLSRERPSRARSSESSSPLSSYPCCFP